MKREREPAAKKPWEMSVDRLGEICLICLHACVARALALPGTDV